MLSAKFARIICICNATLELVGYIHTYIPIHLYIRDRQ